MTDIKMSEVFGGEVVGLSGQEVGASPYDWDCGVLRRAIGGHVAEFDELEKAQAAAHAINQHDKLVEENQRLRKLVGNVIETLWYTKEDDEQTCVGGVGDEEMMLLDSYYKSLNRT